MQIDDFHVIERLQKRKSSSLYLARESETEHLVYLEVLHSPATSELDGRFHDRMHALEKLESTIIPAILGIGRTADNRPYAAMQNRPGNSLAQKLNEWRTAETPLTPVEALTLVRQLADAFTALHPAGIVHQNLRPDAVLVEPNNTLFLTDLGALDAAAPEQTAVSPTELDYASPEQQQGKTLSGRSNIYSLGVILYELLAGHPPELPVSTWDIFERATLPKETPLEQARPGLAVATYEVVKTCLWRQEWSRYETAAALLQAIDDAIAAEEAMALHQAAGGKAKRWLWGAVPLGIVVVLLAGYLMARPRLLETSVTPTETAVPLPTGTATIAFVQPITPTSVVVLPSPTAEYNILLLAPLLGATFNEGEPIIFDWYWPLPLETGQSFSVNLLTGGESNSIGVVSRPVTGSQYRLSVPVRDLDLTTGDYEWYITLETETDANPLVRSGRESFSVVVSPRTATPLATNTPANGETATPAGVCIISPPAGWVVYTVQPGDYLFNLAFGTGVTVERVQEVNCLTESIIGTGLRLWLPSLPATPTPIPSPTLIVPTGKPPKPTTAAATKTPKPPPTISP